MEKCENLYLLIYGVFSNPVIYDGGWELMNKKLVHFVNVSGNIPDTTFITLPLMAG